MRTSQPMPSRYLSITTYEDKRDSGTYVLGRIVDSTVIRVSSSAFLAGNLLVTHSSLSFPIVVKSIYNAYFVRSIFTTPLPID